MKLNSEGKMPLPESMAASDWIDFLIENVTPNDLEHETLYALLHHLEDLGLLVPCEDDTFKWQEFKDGMRFEEQIQNVRDGMKSMTRNESGFAIPFFIGFETTELPAIETLIEPENKKMKNKSNPKVKPASDFSNLQIVKKVGRQLKPFLDAESAIVKRLIGERTSKADARNLFQYMFGKINSKAQPRKWEQLSRKRHR